MALSIDVGLEPVPGYTLDRRLGQGGFGEVWSAKAPGGFSVAMKFVRMGREVAKKEVQSLNAIRNIRHPNLLDIQFAVNVDDCLIIAMPVCEKNLADRLKECKAEGLVGIPLEELRGYMIEAAKGIDFLNERRHLDAEGKRVGIQHRDIKPHNIFLMGGSVRVADFGLAKVLERGSTVHTGSMTPHYAAPEMLRGEVSDRSDQYALAVTYFQLRTGRLPFSGSVHTILMGHLEEEPDLSMIPEAERPALGRGLAKDPSKRWTTCSDFAKALASPSTVLVLDEPEAMTTDLRYALEEIDGAAKLTPAAPIESRSKLSKLSDSAATTPVSDSSTLSRLGKSQPGMGWRQLVVGVLAGIAASVALVILMIDSKPAEIEAMPPPSGVSPDATNEESEDEDEGNRPSIEVGGEKVEVNEFVKVAAGNAKVDVLDKSSSKWTRAPFDPPVGAAFRILQINGDDLLLFSSDERAVWIDKRFVAITEQPTNSWRDRGYRENDPIYFEVPYRIR